MRRLTERRDHARRHRVAKDTGEIVHETPNGNRLVPQPAGRRLCYDRIASRASSDHVDQRRDNEKDSNRQLSFLTLTPSQTTNRDKADEHEPQASHVDGRSAQMGEQKPANDTADNVACGKRNIDVKSLEFSESCCFEELHGVTKDGVTA